MAPGKLKAAVILTATYPTIISILTFRLYLKPFNLSAYEVIGWLTLVYGFIAFLILKHSKKIRWILVTWVISTIIYSIQYQIPSWKWNWSILWIVVFGWALQLSVVTLLFIPNVNSKNEKGA